MASAPNLLIADWIKIFDTENTMPCKPAGTPICNIFLRSGTETDHRVMLKVTGSASRVRKNTIIAAFTPLDITVPHATPATPISNTATNTQSRTRLHNVATSSE